MSGDFPVKERENALADIMDSIQKKLWNVGIANLAGLERKYAPIVNRIMLYKSRDRGEQETGKEEAGRGQRLEATAQATHKEESSLKTHVKYFNP